MTWVKPSFILRHYAKTALVKTKQIHPSVNVGRESGNVLMEEIVLTFGKFVMTKKKNIVTV